MIYHDMEVSEILTVMAIFFLGSGFLIFLTKFLGKSSNSKQKRDVDQSMESWLRKKIRDLQEIHTEEMKRLKESNKTLQGQANKYIGLYKKAREGIIDEQEPDEIDLSQYSIDKNAVKPFLDKFGMNAQALDSPYLQQIVLEKLKGNEELAILLGILKPKFGDTQTQTGPSNQSDFDTRFQTLAQSGQLA